MHVFSRYLLNETSHALSVPCRPGIDIHIIVFAGDEMYSYFVKSVILSIVRRI